MRLNINFFFQKHNAQNKIIKYVSYYCLKKLSFFFGKLCVIKSSTNLQFKRINNTIKYLIENKYQTK